MAGRARSGMGVVTMRSLGVGVVEWRDALAAAIAEHGYDPDEDPGRRVLHSNTSLNQ